MAKIYRNVMWILILIPSCRAQTELPNLIDNPKPVYGTLSPEAARQALSALAWLRAGDEEKYGFLIAKTEQKAFFVGPRILSEKGKPIKATLHPPGAATIQKDLRLSWSCPDVGFAIFETNLVGLGALSPLELRLSWRPSPEKVWVLDIKETAQFPTPNLADQGMNADVQLDKLTEQLQWIDLYNLLDPASEGAPVVDALGKLVGISNPGQPGGQRRACIPADFVQRAFNGGIVQADYLGFSILSGDTNRIKFKVLILSPKKVKEINMSAGYGLKTTVKPKNSDRDYLWQEIALDVPNQTRPEIYISYKGFDSEAHTVVRDFDLKWDAARVIQEQSGQMIIGPTSRDTQDPSTSKITGKPTQTSKPFASSGADSGQINLPYQAYSVFPLDGGRKLLLTLDQWKGFLVIDCQKQTLESLMFYGQENFLFANGGNILMVYLCDQRALLKYDLNHLSGPQSVNFRLPQNDLKAMGMGWANPDKLLLVFGKLTQNSNERYPIKQLDLPTGRIQSYLCDFVRFDFQNLVWMPALNPEGTKFDLNQEKIALVGSQLMINQKAKAKAYIYNYSFSGYSGGQNVLMAPNGQILETFEAPPRTGEKAAFVPGSSGNKYLQITTQNEVRVFVMDGQEIGKLPFKIGHCLRHNLMYFDDIGGYIYFLDQEGFSLRIEKLPKGS
ncbi:MAG: hypothetical protein H6510_16145 [Acidobacteria bacterium]|nr:hypothetical protein [Acidobacteriota bacterium]